MCRMCVETVSKHVDNDWVVVIQNEIVVCNAIIHERNRKEDGWNCIKPLVTVFAYSLAHVASTVSSST